MNRKIVPLVGAAVGLSLFIVFGLLPSLVYGGYAGVLLAGGIAGTPVRSTFIVKALTWFGMLFGVLGVGSLFAIAGAAAGAAVQALTPSGHTPEPEKAPEKISSTR